MLFSIHKNVKTNIDIDTIKANSIGFITLQLRLILRLYSIGPGFYILWIPVAIKDYCLRVSIFLKQNDVEILGKQNIFFPPFYFLSINFHVDNQTYLSILLRTRAHSSRSSIRWSLPILSRNIRNQSRVFFCKERLYYYLFHPDFHVKTKHIANNFPLPCCQHCIVIVMRKSETQKVTDYLDDFCCNQLSENNNGWKKPNLIILVE